MSAIDSFLGAFVKPQEEPEEIEGTSGAPTAPDGLDSFFNTFAPVEMKSYFFYDGTIELRFDIESHTYYLVGPLGELTPQDGVTTILHIIDKSNALVPWGCKMMFEAVVRMMPKLIRDGIEYTKEMLYADFLVMLTEAKAAHRNRLEEAGNIGHIAHQCLEDSIQQALDNDPEKKVRELIKLPTDTRALSCANEAKKWMDAHNVRWVCTEQKVYSREHKVAGTMDGKCLVDSCADPLCCATEFKDRLSIADWKTSNQLQTTYCYQTAIYMFADIEEHGPGVIDRWILRLGKEEGDFEYQYLPYETYEADLKGFMCCLNLVRIHESVEERISQTKKTKKAAKKAAKLALKEIEKEAERLKKALDKAEKKRLKEEEKARLKAEKKANKTKKVTEPEPVVIVTKPFVIPEE